MELIVKKTIELSAVEIASYCNCFNRVFNRIKDPTIFQKEFTHTCTGYSIHSFLKEDDGKIVGGYTGIPMMYNVEGADMLFAFGVDLMIDEGYRNDVSNLLKIIRANEKAMKGIGVKCFYGFPNEISYKVNLAFIRMKDVSLLSTYLLPYKVGCAKCSLKFLNPLSILLSSIMVLTSWFSRGSNIVKYKIEAQKKELEQTRFKWFDEEDYQVLSNDNLTCHWKIYHFNGVKAAFIMDVYPMSKKNFNKAVRGVFKQCRTEVGLIIYVGMLPFVPWSMIKVPHRFEPKKFHFVAKILDKENLNADVIYNPKNWNINLASFDLL